jgi:hypothetical protein
LKEFSPQEHHYRIKLIPPESRNCRKILERYALSTQATHKSDGYLQLPYKICRTVIYITAIRFLAFQIFSKLNGMYMQSLWNLSEIYHLKPSYSIVLRAPFYTVRKHNQSTS